MMNQPTILIVDDEEAARLGMRRALKQYEAAEAGSVEEARFLIAQYRPQLILLDNNLPGTSGMEFLHELAGQDNAPQVVMITAHGTERTAVEAIKAGAYDYLAKPFELDELRLVVKNALEARGLRAENARLKEELAAIKGSGELLGASEGMQKVYDLIAKVAATDITVLIRGESGTGKELVARAIHDKSAGRRQGQFVAMNCAAMPSELIESELFGHEKGSFTGAANQRKGKFEAADGGTIFLDEIGDMSLTTQAKLLRVLEERKIERLGSSHSIPVDVRVISATNVDLEKAVEDGKFRADLYYRLRVVQINLPPLRDRASDIPMLALHFLKGYATKYSLQCTGIHPSSLARLTAYSWPGNIRELRNVIERSAVLADGATLQPNDLPEEINTTAKPAEQPVIIGDGDILAIPYLDDFREARKAFERAYIERCLIETNGNVTRAAEKVGMHRQSLQQKLKDLGLTRRYVVSEEELDEAGSA
ncbi:MAG: sigma-54-dependent Fis family transcriptional regulator [Blastocatellia bacterium]|nr:sigma-54-dependent Fis family transcriptional regulator [Blastocatellia bacterium]